MKRRTHTVIRIHSSVLDRTRGRLVAGPVAIGCALGRSGPVRAKREGDGATPIGRYRALGAVYRADRLRRPATPLPLRATRMQDGWCDDPRDRRYNRPVPLPCAAGHEAMWRPDGLYDLVLDLSYNRRPIRRGRGSAIFLHCAAPGLTPTQGCVAIPRARLAWLVGRIGPMTTIRVAG